MKDFVPIGCWQRWHRKQVSCQLFPLYSILREPGAGDKSSLVSIWYFYGGGTLQPKNSPALSVLEAAISNLLNLGENFFLGIYENRLCCCLPNAAAGHFFFFLNLNLGMFSFSFNNALFSQV